MESKIITREELVSQRQRYKAAGKRVGYTSGVFDIVHPGHVQYLEDARALVDVLIVGVNSDLSVRTNKGPLRPINAEKQRAQVLAGLASVDHVFIFGELNNNRNVELLTPDIYIKAGDYSAEKLTSKAIVESYGGRVELVPFAQGLSTTSVIEKIQLALLSESGPQIRHEPRPAVFLDRDGTINEHIEYLHDPAKFVVLPGCFEGIKKLQENGYRIIVVTNQPGIGLGYFTQEQLFEVNREMMRQASKAGCAFDKIYFCPHSKAEHCPCRKPGTYFLERAHQELSVDLKNSFMIGDMSSDVQLGLNAGCTPILVQTGRGGSDGLFPEATPAYSAKDLSDAADWILSRNRAG
jgi:rfaE bifunctional protein nucleotidyltransferase chain/domain